MNFDKLKDYIDTLPDAGVPGCDLAIWKDHRPVFRHMAGFRDADKKEAMQGDETYCLYSCSKVFTSCAVMQLVEREMIRLDDPVSKYLPAFGNLTVLKDSVPVPAQNTMTIRHLLSMQSGMDYETESPGILAAVEKSGGRAGTVQIVGAMAERPLCFEPGTDFLYSLSHDVLGAVIEVVTGKRFSEYLKENIFEPLSLETIGFSLKEKDKNRQCAQYEFQPETETLTLLGKVENRYIITPSYESGGAGLYGDVKDCILFADAIACGGAGENGTSVLSLPTIQLWSANQLCPRSKKTFDEWNRTGYSYALGVRTRVELQGSEPETIGEFGWDGAAGSWMMIDPHLHLSAFYAMHVKNFNYSYDVIHPGIRRRIYEALQL